MWRVKPVLSHATTLQRVAPLSRAECATLRYGIKQAKHSSVYVTVATNAACQLLLDIKHRGQWLQCDCLVGKQAVMTVCQRAQSIYLRRVTRFPEHAKRCMFYRSPVDSVQTSASKRHVPHSKTLIGIYRTSQAVSTAVTLTNGISRSQTTDSRLPKLGTDLCRLLIASNCVTLTAKTKLLKDVYRDLHKAASQFFIARHRCLYNYFWTHPADVKRACAVIQEAAATWPIGSHPHGFMLVVAQRIEGDRLYCELRDQRYCLTMQQPVRFINGRLGQASAPFLVLFTVTAPATQVLHVCPMDAFAIPIYSTQIFMPIESHFERRVLHTLHRVAISLQRRHVKLCLEKPLFDIVVDQDHTCRPDFIIKSGKKTVVVEVMGSHEDAYLQRKSHTHRLMQHCGELITIDAAAAEKTNTWDERLTQLAKQLYAVLLKSP